MQNYGYGELHFKIRHRIYIYDLMNNYTGLSLSLLILSISKINNEILLYYLNYYKNKETLNAAIYKVKLNNSDAIISSTLRLHGINTDEKVEF